MKFKRYGCAVALLLCLSMNSDCMNLLSTPFGFENECERTMDRAQSAVIIGALIRADGVHADDQNIFDEAKNLGTLFVENPADLPLVFKSKQLFPRVSELRILNGAASQILTFQMLESIRLGFPGLERIFVPENSPIQHSQFQENRTLSGNGLLCYELVKSEQWIILPPLIPEKEKNCCCPVS